MKTKRRPRPPADIARAWDRHRRAREALIGACQSGDVKAWRKYRDRLDAAKRSLRRAGQSIL